MTAHSANELFDESTSGSLLAMKVEWWKMVASLGSLIESTATRNQSRLICERAIAIRELERRSALDAMRPTADLEDVTP